ncbi:hypothetical protein [Pseudoxanthomonas sacheonensis]|uniref:YcxB-like protein domain-containing protein n=1 Tax=Pseudoxanthomonas sacheonensis TaxID=443615 RepID=A0ABU1RW50_9GAMM|nr:hypothetical protein [Pseudoxanthomonas sacheonensis]MDR6842999.1 hypothetical protein [Pseudoxanthomonas sacheonensis]
MDEDALWSRREYHPAERAQPVLGILLLAGTVIWMTKKDPEGISIFFVVFVFGWSLLLIARYPAMSIIRIVQLAWPYLRKPMDQVISFHDYGCSMRIEDSITWNFRWNNLKEVVFGDKGIGIRCLSSDAEGAIQYLYVAKASFAPGSSEYAELESFLRALQNSRFAAAETVR